MNPDNAKLHLRATAVEVTVSDTRCHGPASARPTIVREQNFNFSFGLEMFIV
jgi:hypothetical protein